MTLQLLESRRNGVQREDADHDDEDDGSESSRTAPKKKKMTRQQAFQHMFVQTGELNIFLTLPELSHTGDASKMRSEALKAKTDHDIDMADRRFAHDESRHIAAQRVLALEAEQRLEQAKASAQSELDQTNARTTLTVQGTAFLVSLTAFLGCNGEVVGPTAII